MGRTDNTPKKIRVGLIEDEPFVRADLRLLLSSFEYIDILWEAQTYEDAKQRLKEIQVDLVFLDIQIRGGCGFDLVALIEHKKIEFIIITAHEKYLRKAGKTHALDFLLKPVSRQHLTDILNRLP
ncbi:MAG: response regulator [Desulfobacterales bacterium]|nr:response regulator [Desulfobacterales bacterium]